MLHCTFYSGKEQFVLGSITDGKTASKTGRCRNKKICNETEIKHDNHTCHPPKNDFFQVVVIHFNCFCHFQHYLKFKSHFFLAGGGNRNGSEILMHA
jgi:hypothetical protein